MVVLAGMAVKLDRLPQLINSLDYTGKGVDSDTVRLLKDEMARHIRRTCTRKLGIALHAEGREEPAAFRTSTLLVR